MNICVFTDLRFTTYPRPTGVGKHIFQMVQGLSKIEGNNVSLLAAQDQFQHAGSLSFLPARELPMPWKMAEAVWTTTGHPVADRWCGSPDWIYCPKNDYIPIRKTRVAVTAHGAHELDPQMPQPSTIGARLNRLRRRVSYARMLHEAGLVLTVSEFLKQQMVEWFGLTPAKVCVVGNGVEPEFFHAATQAPGLSGEPADRPFVLCVGGLNFLDGGDRIIEVASALRRKAPEMRVLVAGLDHRPELIVKAAELSNVHLVGYLRSEQLACYMRDAMALLYPTRYETFGIAAAEAMAAGTPVITCRSTAVPEVVGDAAIYMNADQPESIIEALMALQSQPGFRQDLIGRGQSRATAYTWPACVARLQAALLHHSNGKRRTARTAGRPCRIIINADDLGISCDVDDTIFNFMAEGRVTSATMLANGPHVVEAAARVHEFPRCSFGVHLNLTEFKPLTTHPGLGPILNAAGEFDLSRIREIQVGPRLREAIFHEWCTQIERLRTLGVNLSHIDSHHHAHTIPSLFGVLKRVQKVCGIQCIRLSKNLYNARSKTSGVLLLKKRVWNFAVRNLYPTITTAAMTDLNAFLETARGREAIPHTIEVMVHPGSPLFQEETEMLRGRWIDQLPFEVRLISYRDL